MKTYFFLLIGSVVMLLPTNAVSQSTPQWTVIPAQYEHFMTITGTLVLNGTTAADSNYWIGAFVGEQCRGIAKPVLLIDHWIFFLLTYGNVQGEQLTFRIHNTVSGITYTVSEALLFQPSAAVGEPSAPFVFHSTITSVENSGSPILTFQLHQNYPNPFNPTTSIGYQLPASGMTTLKVYDALGREVVTLVNEVKEAGYFSTTFDASKLSSGIYFAKLQSGDKVQMKKMSLIR